MTFVLDSLRATQFGGLTDAANQQKQEEKKLHYCPKCHRGFTLKHNRNRHLKYECGYAPRFACPYCNLRGKQSSQIYRHIRNVHQGQNVYYVDLKT